MINKYDHDVFFDIENNYIRCTILLDVEVISKTKMNNVDLNKAEKKVIIYLLDDESNPGEDIAKKINSTKRTNEKALRSLQSKG